MGKTSCISGVVQRTLAFRQARTSSAVDRPITWSARARASALVQREMACRTGSTAAGETENSSSPKASSRGSHQGVPGGLAAHAHRDARPLGLGRGRMRTARSRAGWK